MSGYDYVVNPRSPTLGGNIWQGDPWTHSPGVWKYMIERFAVRTVLDVGSGRGHAANWFHKNGCQVVAIDGESINVKSALYPTVQHDITGSVFVCPVDFVHCQEVAEHIPEKYLGNFLSTLYNGNVILMTHASPGQEGHNHVNCQDDEYWILHLDKCGYNLLLDDTAKVRAIAGFESAHHLARSGLVFARRMSI